MITQKLEVLAVMSLTNTARNGVCPHCYRDYSDGDMPDTCSDDCPGEEARTAVAELVEAARDIHENGYGTAANKRLGAALAKFGGAE